MRVFGWVADYAGCGYYRVQTPLRVLADQSSNISTAASGRLEFDQLEDLDLVVGQRVQLPAPTVFWQTALPGHARRVYEIDDDLWNVHPTSPAYQHFADPEVQARMAGNAHAADAVTVSTEPLAHELRKLNDRVFVLPNYIDETLLTWDRPRTENVTVGWAGSATHAVDFQTVADPLRQFFRKYPNVDFHLISEVGFGRAIGDALRKTVTIMPWRPVVDDYHRSVDFDIGLAPLASNHFNDCKSEVKFLEYAALGIPCVASDFGPYRRAIEHGVTGFLCKTERDWFRYVRLLVEDPDLRETIGKQAREWAADHTIQGHADEWKQVYEEIVA